VHPEFGPAGAGKSGVEAHAGEATILTGEKTIFQYLLKPVYLTLDTALRER